MMAAVKPRLLLVPSFTELEWGIRPVLEEWVEVISFDTPGVGGNETSFGVVRDSSRSAESLSRWRDAAARIALREVDRSGWERFFIVADSYGSVTGVRIAGMRPDAILGMAIGHAALSHATEGERATERAVVWEAMTQLARQGSEAFVRYGIAQMTRGGIDEETAQQMVERFPDMDLIQAMVEAIGREPEPIGDQLAAMDSPLLLAKHDGCLSRTDEGFEDIVAAFPEAATVNCPEMCASSPAFAEALREFCERVGSEQGARA